MTYCGERSIVKSNAAMIEAVTLKCRAWTCPDCEPLRKAQLIAQAHRGRPNTFITLTVRSTRYANPAMAAQALAGAWRIITKRAAREAARSVHASPYPFGACEGEEWDLNGRTHWPRQVRFQGETLQYLAVIEAHKSGWPHLHILCRSEWIDQKWLKAQTIDLLDAPIVDVQRINRHSQVNAYVAKYCGKCAHKFGTAKRYWQTKRYPKQKYEKPAKKVEPGTDVWHGRERIHQYVWLWQSRGWNVWQDSKWHAATDREAQAPPEPGAGCRQHLAQAG